MSGIGAGLVGKYGSIYETTAVLCKVESTGKVIGDVGIGAGHLLKDHNPTCETDNYKRAVSCQIVSSKNIACNTDKPPAICNMEVTCDVTINNKPLENKNVGNRSSLCGKKCLT